MNIVLSIIATTFLFIILYDRIPRMQSEWYKEKKMNHTKDDDDCYFL